MVVKSLLKYRGCRGSFDLCELLGSAKCLIHCTICLICTPAQRLPAAGVPAQVMSAMGLVLKITSEHKELLGDDSEREFGEDGGTIGRSLQADWILPDPDRYISGKHATIDFQAGSFYLADISSNGVFVNDDCEPLGKGNPRRLFDGDKIRMGDFEFEVALEQGESLDMPPEEPMTVVPDHIEQLVPEESIKTGIDLLGEEELTGDQEFQSTLFGGPVKEIKVEEASEKVDNNVNPFEAKKEEGPQHISPAELIDALFDGAGISRSEIHPSVDPLEVMRNTGQVLQEFISGITDLLKCRTNMKSMFRLDQTTTLPRHNNPLKLSEDVRSSLKQLLVGEEGEYLGPTDSVKEVCRDLKFHHDAILAAMNISFGEFADRFDPDELKENFDRTLKKKPLFDALNQLRYWRLYCDLYPIMTQRGSGQFPHMFGEEFVREYEKQIAEYKRLDREIDDDDSANIVQAVKEELEEEEELQDQSAEAQANPLV
jgi:predicted component of type VI protein secretion system